MILSALLTQYLEIEAQAEYLNHKRRELVEMEARICATIRRMAAAPDNFVTEGPFVFHVFEVTIGREERLNYFRVSRQPVAVDRGLGGYSFSPGSTGVLSAVESERRRRKSDLTG